MSAPSVILSSNNYTQHTWSCPAGEKKREQEERWVMQREREKKSDIKKGIEIKERLALL